MKKEKLQKILYKNYEPVKGLGADEIDIAIDQILELFQAQKQELAEKIEKIPKMDYLKWQLRKDLTKDKDEPTIEEAENRAKGWNVCKKYILKQLLK